MRKAAEYGGENPIDAVVVIVAGVSEEATFLGWWWST
jgi:hypothetical protein